MSSNEDEVDLRTLNYTESINANLICCICQAPFVDPVVLTCGHTYCSLCIYQAVEASPACPIDRSPIVLDDIRPAVKIITNMVNELLVRCPRSDEGCDYIGQRQFIESHLKNDCMYTFASCSMDECKTLVLKKDLGQHISTCKYRSTECKMCKRKMRAFELEDHHQLCPAEIIQCPHCDTSRPRSEHTSHLHVCPRHPVTCTHAEFGCQWKGDRESLDSKHVKECPYEGIKHYLIQQRKRDQTLQDEVIGLRTENDMFRRQQGDLMGRFQALLDQLAILFPSHFSDVVDEDTHISEMQGLRNQLETVTTSLQSLELKQNMALMNETFRLQEEIQSLRTICHGIRMQMHYLIMDRRGATAAGSSSNNAAENNGTGGSVQVLNKVMSWLDTPHVRQDTKL